MKPKKYFSEEEILDMMVTASKWGSHAYLMEYKRHNNVLNVYEFDRHRMEVMENILKRKKDNDKGII